MHLNKQNKERPDCREKSIYSAFWHTYNVNSAYSARKYCVRQPVSTTNLGPGKKIEGPMLTETSIWGGGVQKSIEHRPVFLQRKWSFFFFHKRLMSETKYLFTYRYQVRTRYCTVLRAIVQYWSLFYAPANNAGIILAASGTIGTTIYNTRPNWLFIPSVPSQFTGTIKGPLLYTRHRLRKF